MNEALNKKLDELIELLDNNKNIKDIERLKKEIPESLLKEIEEYRLNPTSENKTKLYSNPFYKEWINTEQNINYIIMNISKNLRG